MLPIHCKDVSVREVDHPLTEEGIANGMKGRKAYIRSDFLVLRNGDEHAVLKLIKASGKELFRSVLSYEVISFPDETLFIRDPKMDILNPSALLQLSMQHPGKTLVVEGVFSHVNFVHGLQPLHLRVLDNIPPAPSKLSCLVRQSMASGFLDLPILPQVMDIDMQDKLAEVATEAVMFPCQVSGLKADKPVYFLDQAPDLEHEVTLIGCHLSQRIFESLYRKDVPFVNVCPADFIPDDDVPTIVKCCKVKSGHQIEGRVAKVPWGATVPEVTRAIEALFSGSEQGSP